MQVAFESLRAVVSGMPGLRLLVLHGSRARNEAHARSDWDFAYLAGPAFDPDRLFAVLSERLTADQIDLADLSRASVLLKHTVAGDGIVVFEAAPGVFKQFQLDAITTWGDMESVLRAESEASLARLHQ